MTRGLIIAAPSSGSGKTTITLALLRLLRNRGVAVASAKAGPDYIDPAFHSAASGRPCLNLDSWAMRRSLLATLVQRAEAAADMLLVEGVMGLFDGAADGSGSTAELARFADWPVVLVVDARGMSASAAALVHGFANYDPEIRLAGVIFNRIGGPAHAALLRQACAALSPEVLGCIPRRDALTLPERHLGLVQAGEHPDLEAFLEGAAALIGAHIDVEALDALARPSALAADPDPTNAGPGLPPLGQHIAVARDTAFAFAYPFVLDAWRAAGAELSFFSPLADEAPAAESDAVYLPGGYPELHAGRLASNSVFLNGLRAAVAGDATIYGECGGYMVLGRALVDAEGVAHEMAGLLSLESSFAEPKLTLGYRRADLAENGGLGTRGTAFRGHEFHFASVRREPDGRPLFQCRDSAGRDLGGAGEVSGKVSGSFVHLIDREA